MRRDLASIEDRLPRGPERVGALFELAAANARQPDYRGCCFVNAVAESLDVDRRVTGALRGVRDVHLRFFASNATGAPASRREDRAKTVLTIYNGAKVTSVLVGADAFRVPREMAVAVAAGAELRRPSAG